MCAHPDCPARAGAPMDQCLYYARKRAEDEAPWLALWGIVGIAAAMVLVIILTGG